MNPLTWQERLSIPFPSIDEEHKMLFDLINEFYQSLTTHNRTEQILNLFTQLRSYAQLHFENEETLMLKHKYPRLDIHQVEHQLFIEKIDEFEKQYKNGRLFLTFEMTNYLKEWITHHVDIIDRDYSNFITNSTATE